MMNKNTFFLIVLTLMTVGCSHSQDKIIPGSSIGDVAIGAKVEASKLKSYRNRLKELGIVITTEKGTEISSITTTSPKYRVNTTLIQVGTSVSDLLAELGLPVLVDGNSYNGQDLNKMIRGFLAFEGVVVGINQGKIASITVVPIE